MVAYLKAENAYADAQAGAAQAAQDRLSSEIVGRVERTIPA